jgi:hypothetical protein
MGGHDTARIGLGVEVGTGLPEGVIVLVNNSVRVASGIGVGVGLGLGIGVGKAVLVLVAPSSVLTSLSIIKYPLSGF